MRLAESINDPRFLLGFLSCLSTALSGIILGNWRQTDKGTWYIAYEGIPYAKPPIDHLRFEPPQTNVIWPRLGASLIATEIGFACMQWDPVRNVVRGREDCLHMNIYRPDPKISAEGNPVIFYIHGPDFQIGNGGFHQGQHLLNAPVILVTFNYRLGALGFLSTEDDIVPGNMGLKDQVHALKWVKRYIDNFGGDPTNITIIGHGAGGASVHYHYMSPLTKGLFKQGMSMSGTALSPWAQAKGALEKTKNLARLVQCHQSSNLALVNCLKNTTADDIITVSLKFKTYKNTPYAPFGPVIEKKNPTALITESPTDTLLAGRAHDLPWITGMVSSEGLSVVAAVVANNKEIEHMGDDWQKIAPDLLDFNYTMRPWKQARAAEWIRKEYVGAWSFAPWTINPTLRMVTDRMIGNGASLAARLHAKMGKSPVRFYRFQYRGLESFTEHTTGSLKDFGVAPGDDLAYIFDLGINLSFRKTDRTMRKALIGWWVSYAQSKNGTPTMGEYWPPVSKNYDDAVMLHILNPTYITTAPLTAVGRLDFWWSLDLHEDPLLKDPIRPKLNAERTFWEANHIEPCNGTEITLTD